MATSSLSSSSVRFPYSPQCPTSPPASARARAPPPHAPPPSSRRRPDVLCNRMRACSRTVFPPIRLLFAAVRVEANCTVRARAACERRLTDWCTYRKCRAMVRTARYFAPGMDKTDRPGWLFLFAILLTAILLFVMVFYVRTPHSRLTYTTGDPLLGSRVGLH